MPASHPARPAPAAGRSSGQRRRVLAVVSPIWEESAARLLKGIALYQREHEAWDVHWDNEGLSIVDPNWLTRERWDGVISRHTNELQVRACARLGLPLVDVNDVETYPGVINVALDNEAVGQLGGEHFIDRGFQNFGFCGFGNEPWARARGEGFREAVAAVGRHSTVFELDYPGTYGRGITPQWHGEQITAIAGWLKQLPRPIGIMACNDFRALHVLQAARQAGLRVPEDIAVLGANDDEARCELATPPLSSVATNHQRSGYLAAAALDCLLASRGTADMDLLVEPLGVVTRQSSDVLAVDDPRVAHAVRLIHQNACQGLTVDQLCRQVGAARTQLEQRFRRYFSRSPQAEIRRVQLERIQQLLRETDLPLRAIADLTGFAHEEYMIVFFKRAMGLPPGRYRRNLRFPSAPAYPCVATSPSAPA